MRKVKIDDNGIVINSELAEEVMEILKRCEGSLTISDQNTVSDFDGVMVRHWNMINKNRREKQIKIKHPTNTMFFFALQIAKIKDLRLREKLLNNLYLKYKSYARN